MPRSVDMGQIKVGIFLPAIIFEGMCFGNIIILLYYKFKFIYELADQCFEIEKSSYCTVSEYV